MELFVILSAIVVVLVQCLSCQKLVAVELGAKLPHPTQQHASLYDGDDRIYILGGVPYSKIYSYSLGADHITELTTFPNIAYHGFATFNDQGDILYMGGHYADAFPDGNIYKLHANNWDLKVVQTNKKFGRGRGIKATDGSNTLFIPIQNETMFCLNLSTFVSCGSTPLLTKYRSVRPFVYEGHAYLTGTDPEGFIEKVNLETLGSELIDVQLPYFYYHEVVFDGTYAYIIGSISGLNKGIIRLNTKNMEHQFFTVENFPVNYTDPNTYWYGGSAVYVEKLNRIYFSGGVSSTIGTRDEIWYIDLTPISEPIPATTPEELTSYPITEESTSYPTTEVPISTTLNPDIFTCRNKPQGFYPHPYDCAQFIGCHNGTSEFYECPEPLLFSQILLACTFPEDVDCDISCTGKPDGMYEHPHDCSLFIACHNTMLEIYKCPFPLLFDPETKQCNFPEQVECKTKPSKVFTRGNVLRRVKALGI